MAKIITEFRVLLKNEIGSLSKLCDILKKDSINIISVNTETNTRDNDIIHIITDNIDKTEKALKKAKLPFGAHDIIEVAVDDKPGGLGSICKSLADAKINIDYIYVIGYGGDGKILVGIATKKLQDALKALEKI